MKKWVEWESGVGNKKGVEKVRVAQEQWLEKKTEKEDK
jgi:rRNA biogenesis protein RRP5